MEKTTIKYIVDVLMGISFILIAFTGIIKFPGFVRYLGMRHADLPMGQFTLIHDYAGIVMVILVLIHLILNWKWISAMTKKMFVVKK